MKLSLFASTMLTACCALGVAHAQTAETNTPQAGTEVEDKGSAAAEIVVTGSRIARRDYVSDSPIISQTGEQIRNTGDVNVTSVLNRLPQFVPGQGSYTQAQGGRATLNLRGLGEQRNLILLDGRRLPPATALGVVNINIIPTAILEGVETISGGASATYGSDAISGVVNFKTKRNFRGVELDVQKGISDRGDASQTDANLTAGFGDDRSHGLITVGYFTRDSMPGIERSFYRNGAPSSFILPGVYTPSANNLPDQAVVNTVFGGYGIAPGAVARTNALGFNDNGTLFSQLGGLNYQGGFSPYAAFLNGTIVSPNAPQTDAASAQTRYSVFGKFDHEVSDAVTLYGQALFIDDRVRGDAGWVPSILAVPQISMSNPFIPADLRQILNSRPNPTAPFLYNRRFGNLDKRVIENHSTTYQILAGAKGDLGIGDLSWDIYASRGQTRMVENFENAVLRSRLNNLFGAADGGVSICAGGFNPFGVAAGADLSQQCEDYLSVDTHAVTKVDQDVVEGVLQGKLFSLGAEDVRFALSANYRRDKYSFSPDTSIAGGDVLSAIVAPAAGGERDVKEIAGELFIPILRDTPFFRSLDLDLSYRYSDYKISGSASTYKASLTWKPVAPLLLRGGYERALRAPGLAELFATASGGLAQFGVPPSAGDPCDSRSVARTGANAARIRDLCIATGVPSSVVDTYVFPTNAVIGVSSGSTALEPETADTFTLGAVLRSWSSAPLLRNMSLSVDYYNISVDKVISTIAPGTVINKCYNLDGSNSGYSASNFYCSFINRDISGGITTVDTPYLNLGGLKTSGIDVQFDWTIPMG